ncbi:MAG: phenylacetate-CoA oxygenase subunit PaaI [Anaerolineales bacterium]|nr:phenylacetate-CoA oxygenase subunit PaaI [Anaerolineales bacterium]
MTTPLPALLVRLADNKYLLGRRFSEWSTAAPALEAAVAAAAMTQDELGHARSLYAALQSAPDGPDAYLNEGRRLQRLGAPILRRPFRHWAEFVAAAGLFDRAMTLVFEAARNCGYEPLRQRAAKILQEEWFHGQYGQGWLRQLAAGPKTRAAMQAAVDQFWQPTADWLATVEAGARAANVLTKNTEALRQAWLDETRAVLSGCGLRAP